MSKMEYNSGLSAGGNIVHQNRMKKAGNLEKKLMCRWHEAVSFWMKAEIKAEMKVEIGNTMTVDKMFQCESETQSL